MKKQRCALNALWFLVVGLCLPLQELTAATLSFEGNAASVVGATVEQGFEYSAFSGALWRSDHAGNPAPNLEADALAECPGCASGFGGVVEVVAVDGSDFFFEAVDVAKNLIHGTQFVGPQIVQFTGYRDGAEVAVDRFSTSADNYVWTNQVPVENKDVVLDELRIHLEGIETAEEFGFQAIDNLVLTPVPEPSTLTALLIALGLFCLRRPFSAQRRNL